MAPLRQSHQTSPVVPGVHTGNAFADLWRDLRHAARMLRWQPGFAVTTVLTLALAIGATTAIFTVVDATLLRPLPFPQPDRLVQIGRAFQGEFSSSVSPPKFLHWRREGHTVFDETAACSSLGSAFSLIGSGPPERVPGALVSAAFFDVMGVRPLLGRAFQQYVALPRLVR